MHTRFKRFNTISMFGSLERKESKDKGESRGEETGEEWLPSIRYFKFFYSRYFKH